MLFDLFVAASIETVLYTFTRMDLNDGITDCTKDVFVVYQDTPINIKASPASMPKYLQKISAKRTFSETFRFFFLN